MHRVFISYHHNDQRYKDGLVNFGGHHSIFVDKSVDTGDISDNLSAEQIRTTIRDDYLRDSTVTIVLVGVETKRRKHVDWEVHSSMYDGSINKRSGVVVINLPEIYDANFVVAPYGDEEKKLLYPDIDIRSWITIDKWEQCKRIYPHMPERIIDNLVEPNVTISVVPWERIVPSTWTSPWEQIIVRRLKFLIDKAFDNRSNCEYDLRRPMKRANS